MPVWTYLGEGTYNSVYKNENDTLVLKIPKDYKEYPTETPNRCVRLWNSVNSHLSPPARVVMTDLGYGWTCPFVKGVQANDSEMMNAVIDIFNRTGRVLVDAPSPKNFIKTPAGQIVCVDIGFALQLEKREEELELAQLAKSTISRKTWDHELITEYDKYFRGCDMYPQTVQIIKVLLFIKNYRPDIINANFLKDPPGLIVQLAQAYDAKNASEYLLKTLDEKTPPSSLYIKPIPIPVPPPVPIFTHAKHTLFQPINNQALEEVNRKLNKYTNHALQQAKTRCVNTLKEYINSRGTLNYETIQFTPSWKTRIFRNQSLTNKKVHAISELIQSLENASSLIKIEELLNAKLAYPELVKSFFSSGLKESVAKCLDFVELGKQEVKISTVQSFK